MNRKNFIKLILGGMAVTSLESIRVLSNSLKSDNKLMPVLFIGHGSPMNAIEDNEFTRTWNKMGKSISLPKAVLVISAHWLTKGTYVTAMDNPRTIHDFGGFPDELFKVQYLALGSKETALLTQSTISSTNVMLDHDWGLDHGTWSVVKHMYPEANIPVLQLSIDYNKPAQYHYELAKELAELRKKGILIIGSGNMVHNLRMIAWDKLKEPEFGFDWALEMNSIFKKNISELNHQSLINYQNLSKAASLAIPTPDHYYPLLYSLALQNKKDDVLFFNDKAVGGSLTMTSVKIG